MGRQGPRAHVSRAALGATLVGGLAIAYYTLFPFDFVATAQPWWQGLRRFALTSGDLLHPRNVPANVVLFVPLGLGVAGLLRARTGRARRVAATTAIGLVVSTFVECAQATFLLRDPALDDIVANTVGAMLGALAWVRFGDGARRGLRSLVTTRPTLWRSAALVVAAVPMVLVLAIVVHYRDLTLEMGWDPSYPLAVGNEPTGQRAWTGAVGEVAVADVALSPDAARDWLDGSSMGSLLVGATVVELRPDGGADLPDGWRWAHRAGADGPRTTSVPAPGWLEVGPDRWVEWEGSVADLALGVDGGSSFTAALEVEPATLEQGGPARILSIAPDPYRLDLAVGQEGVNLVVRVRTALMGGNGSTPQLAVARAFADGGPRRIVVTYDGGTVRVYVAGQTTSVSTLRLQPATAPLIRLFPDEVAWLRFSSLGGVLRAGYLALIAFGPWCLWMALVRGRRGSRVLTGALVVLPVLVGGVILATVLPSRTFPVLATAVVAAAALLGTTVVAATTGRPSTVGRS